MLSGWEGVRRLRLLQGRPGPDDEEGELVSETELQPNDEPDPRATPHIPDLPPDCTVVEGALAYAEAGWYVGPIRSGVV